MRRTYRLGKRSVLALLGVRGIEACVLPHNKQLQRTVIRRRGRVARASFHYARAPRLIGQRAAAELRRYALSR